MSRSVLVFLTFPPAYALSILLARATRVGDSEVALVWPAAAVAVLWLLAVRHCQPRQRAFHMVLLGLVTFGMNAVTGAPLPLSGWFALVNIALAVVTVEILHYGRDVAVLRDPMDLARVIGAVAAGTVCAAVLATVYLAPATGAPAWETFALFTARNGASALVGVAVWLRLPEIRWARPRLSVAAVGEALAVGAVIVFVFVWIFWLHTGAPITFAALLPSAWVALRYSTTVSTLFLTVAAGWIVFATLSDRGPLVVPDAAYLQALLAQGMVCSLLVVVLALALYRDSRAQLIAELEAARDRLREAHDLFAGVLQAASEQAIIGTDPSGRITVFNNGAERLLGWTEAEMLGRTPIDFHYRPEVTARAEELGTTDDFDVFVHNVTPESAETREWTYVRRDGTRVDVSLSVTQMTDERGVCLGYIGVATDISQRKKAERALTESEERFRLAFDTAPTGMFMFDLTSERRGHITRCNRALGDFLGRSRADLLGMSVTALCADDDASDGLAQLLDLKIGDTVNAEVAFRRADGRTVWGAVSASVVASPEAGPYGICLVENITSRRRAAAELQHSAQHDPLTGLPNRALLMDRIEQALEDAEGNGPDCVGLLYLDLDGFKPVNDTYGHASGDEVLQAAALRIKNSIRPTDTAARLGGDEFAVLCPVIGDHGRLRRIAERIQTELRRPVPLSNGATYQQLSVSIGVAESDSGSTADSLLRRADRLMYEAKRNGRDRIVEHRAADGVRGHRRTAHRP